MDLNKKQIDAFKEILTIGIGRSADVLNKVSGKRVHLEIPEVLQFTSVESLRDEFRQGEVVDWSSIDMPFRGELTGSTQLAFHTKDAGKLVSMFIGDESDDLEFNSLMKSSLAEIGNIVLNSLVGTIGNIFNTRIEYSMPTFFDHNEMDSKLRNKAEKNLILYAKTVFTISEVNIVGSFIFFLEIRSIDRFSQLINESYLVK